MYYELYIDKFFAVSILMNFLLLFMVNECTLSTISVLRILGGAVMAALGDLLCLVIGEKAGPGCWVVRVFWSLLVLLTVFSLRSVKALGRLFLLYCFWDFMTESLLVFLDRHFFGGNTFGGSGFKMVACGGVMVLFFLLARIGYQKLTENTVYGAVLIMGEKRVVTGALLDTGNSLREPISNSPVCVIDKKIWEELEAEGMPFRVIPFQSIGEKRGILKGYRLEELELETVGPVKRLRNIYVAVSEESILEETNKAVGMILHPDLLKNGWKKMGNRRNKYAKGGN